MGYLTCVFGTISHGLSLARAKSFQVDIEIIIIHEESPPVIKIVYRLANKCTNNRVKLWECTNECKMCVGKPCPSRTSMGCLNCMVPVCRDCWKSYDHNMVVKLGGSCHLQPEQQILAKPERSAGQYNNSAPISP